VTGRFDQWRILARGPVPDVVLNNYLGHIEITPPTSSRRNQPAAGFVAERASSGTRPMSAICSSVRKLLRCRHQVQISNFVKKGGRIA